MSSKRNRKRRMFSEEFKRDAVNLVVVEGYTIAAAARAVGVLDGSLREPTLAGWVFIRPW